MPLILAELIVLLVFRNGPAEGSCFKIELRNEVVWERLTLNLHPSESHSILLSITSCGSCACVTVPRSDPSSPVTITAAADPSRVSAMPRSRKDGTDAP